MSKFTKYQIGDRHHSWEDYEVQEIADYDVCEGVIFRKVLKNGKWGKTILYMEFDKNGYYDKSSHVYPHRYPNYIKGERV